MSLYPIFSLLALFIIVPGIIFLFIFIYQSIYKRQINHVLRDDQRAYRTIEPMPLVLGVILIILTVFTLSTSSKVGKLQDKLDDQTSLIEQLRGQINSLSGIRSDIYNLERQFDDYKKSQAWIQESSYEIKGISEENANLFKVQIRFNLREIQPSSQIYLAIVNKNDGNDQQKIALNSTTLSYAANLELSMEKDYKAYVIEESANNTKNEQLMELDFKGWKENRIQIDQKSAVIYGRDGQIELVLAISNNTLGLDDFKIQSGTLKVYNGSTLLDTVILNDDLEIRQSGSFEQIFYTNSLTIDESKDLTIQIDLEDRYGNIYQESLTYHESNMDHID